MSNNSQSNEDLLLLKWLHIHRPDLVEKVQPKQPQKEGTLRNISLFLIQFAFSAIWAKAEEFDGQAITSQETELQAKLTSGVVSGATLFNAITNWPILFYAFRYSGPIVAFILSVVLNLIILWWTNQTGTTAATRKHGNRLWSTAGIMAFVAISTVQSVVAGVGAELINNQSGLVDIYATELANQPRDKIGELKEKRNDQIQVCQKALENWELKNETDPNRIGRDAEWEAIMGQTHTERSEGKEPRAGTPCGEEYHLRQEITALENRFSQYFNLRETLGSDIKFLEKLRNEGLQGSGIYDQHFIEENGHIKVRSGAKAIQLASDNFWSNISRAPWEAESLSQFFLALSIITSLSAAILIWMHSHKLNTKMSRNSNVKEAVEHWLESIRRSYSNRPQAQKSATDEKLLAYFIDEYRQEGKCDYPMAQTIAKLTQEGIHIGLFTDGENLSSLIQKAYILVDKACFKLDEQISRTEASEPLNLTILRTSLSQLTEGGTRLLLLTQKYTVHLSLEGKHQPHARLHQLENSIKKRLHIIAQALCSGLLTPNVQPDKQSKGIDKIQINLIGLHNDCVELKEIAQEEIREKISLLFGKQSTIPPQS